MRLAKSDRKINVNGVDMCWCITHQDYLPCEEFYIRPKVPTGYDYRCSECARAIAQKNRYDRLGYEKMDDKTATNVVLTILGYDPHSDIPVHEQFIQKHYDRI